MNNTGPHIKCMRTAGTTITLVTIRNEPIGVCFTSPLYKSKKIDIQSSLIKLFDLYL